MPESFLHIQFGKNFRITQFWKNIFKSWYLVPFANKHLVQWLRIYTDSYLSCAFSYNGHLVNPFTWFTYWNYSSSIFSSAFTCSLIAIGMFLAGKAFGVAFLSIFNFTSPRSPEFLQLDE